MQKFNCFIFDLDGVIVDTAKYHFKSWKWVCSNLDIDFSEKQNEALKGISRVDSLNYLLNLGKKTLSPSEKEHWLKAKNERYLEFVKAMANDEILPGVLPLLKELKAANKAIALGSASKNAKLILKTLDLEKFFDVVIDGNAVTHSKPNPEVFLKGARACKALSEEVVVFEDSLAGIQAAKKAGFKAVGIGEKNVLKEADYVFSNFENLSLETLISYISGT